MHWVKRVQFALAPRPLHPALERVNRLFYFAIKACLRRFRLWRYFGRRFSCPCCKGRFRRFLPHGVKPRTNAQCPGCGALERHRLMWFYLDNRTNLYTDQLKVLHFAPEVALQKKLVSMPNLDYISADLCSPRAQVKFDICSIPFPDNTFNVVLCVHVLEHVLNDRKAISELFRVMGPGGWGILQVPLDRNRQETFEDWSVVSPEDRERVFGQRDHVRIYGVDYYDRLRAVGFEVRLDAYVKELPRQLIIKHNLPEGEVICLCSKPESKDG